MSRESAQIRVALGLAFVLILMSGAHLAVAQVTGGGITGTITDSTGATIPQVKIEATNNATGLKYTAQATGSGTYLLSNLPVGSYTVTAEHPGFKTAVHNSVAVLTATTTTLNIELVIGQVAQQVTVSESATPIVVTNSAETGTVLERSTIMDLPLSLGAASQVAASGRRQIENFMFLTPGVTGTQFSKTINGSPGLMQEVIIDGIPHDSGQTPGFIAQTSPPFESVQEFKIATGNYPAQYGRGFGVEIFTIKSGTNQFHGDAFEYIRNNAFDARGFFTPTKSPLRQNEFGGTIGGPVRKDKTFFFGAYSGFWLGGGILGGRVSIPTEAFRSGDFSQLKNPSTGQLIPTYNPASTRPDGQGGFTRDPFPGNIIPSGQISPIAGRVMSLLPQPDFPGIVGNYTNRSIEPTHDNDFAFKIDNRFNDKNHASLSMWWDYASQTIYQQLGQGQPLDSGVGVPFFGGGIRGNWDMIINSHWLNHFGFGYSSSDPVRRPVNDTKGNQILKIPGLPDNAVGFPAFYIPGYPEFGNSDQQPHDPSLEKLYVGTDTMSWVHGKHQVKFGGEIWRDRYTNFPGTNGGGVLGVFNFNNLETSLPNSPNFGAYGFGLASFLLGQVDSSQNLVGPLITTYSHPYAGFFVQDQIQITPKLTFSPGIRYDLAWPWRDISGRMSALDPTMPNPGAGFIPGALMFGADKVVPPLDTSEWGPRVGLAYRVANNTVLRLGYGINYAQSNAAGMGAQQFGNGFDSGYSATNSFTSLNNGITPAYSLDAGVPPFTGKLPNFNPAQNNRQTIDYMNRYGAKQAQEQTWMFDIQRELPWSINLDAAYVGNRGSHLPANLENLNQVSSGYLSLGSVLLNPIGSPAAITAGILPPYAGFTGSVAQALRPFPQFTSINNAIQPIGNSRYDAMQIKMQKRISSGLAFLVAYTLSKQIDDTGTQGYATFARASRDTANQRLEYSLDGSNPTHNLQISWVYKLPFAESHKGFSGKVLGGWAVNGILSYVGGAPLSFGGSTPLPLFNGGNRPDRVLGTPIRTSLSYGQYDPGNPNDVLLNINAFKVPAPFTFGTLGPTTNVRGFPSYNENLSLVKRTYVPSISEAFNVEFRIETFNTFNRTVFSNPSTNITDPTTFGRVFGQANQPRIIQFALKLIW